MINLPYKNIKGERFGRLIAIEIIAEKYKKTKWLCECDCGNKKAIPLDSLLSGKGKSCGCLRKEVTKNRVKTHGLTNTRLHNVWANMKNRCYNNKNKSYVNYGGRGIKVCDEWLSFENFYKWSLQNGYDDNLTIDRIENNKKYEPSNCRWSDMETQANNTRKNVFVEIEGIRRTLAQHAKHYKINYYTLHYRYNEKGLRGKELIKGEFNND